jgi:Fic family protein
VPLYLSPYIEAHKQQYYEALKAAQQRLEYEAMIGYLSDAISGTVHEIKRTREALTRLKVSWLKRRSFRAGSAADAALVLLHEYPVITVGRLEQMLGVSFQAAATAAKQLESVGILTERTGYRRNRVFAATEVLGVLNRPYGANT